MNIKITNKKHNTNEYKNYSFKVKKSNLSNLTEKNQ